MSSSLLELRISLGAGQGAVESRLASLSADRYLARLWAKDVTLWGDDPEHQDVARHRLGWLDSPQNMAGEIEALRRFAADVREAGFTHAVLLGMGGSSLAPEVFALTYGKAADGLELTVLDNTSPAAVRAIEDTHDPERTLFVVSSKSGGTIEVRSFEAHFYEWVRAARGNDAGASFVAVTDPDTPLGELAGERGYRQVWTNDPKIGGRYSALSFFGLVPAALIGVDLDALLAAAMAEAQGNGAAVTASDAPGLVLGGVLGELGRAGRDKVTLVTGAPFEAFGSWAEQLIAESTGKSGRGLVPIADEPAVDADGYGEDRVFVAFSCEPLPDAVTARLDALEKAGHPVIRWRDPSVHSLGAEFLRWEIATVVASSILEVDPFDEPNVTEAKKATSAVLDRYMEHGNFAEPQFTAQSDALAVEASERVLKAHGQRDEADPSAYARLLADLAGESDYVAILAYMHRTPERHELLQSLRAAILETTGRATTLGYGPRFLHSTGQLHKGGADNGVFLQLTADEPPDVAIPGQKYGFAALRWAQAAGDYDVLEKRGRLVIRVRLGEMVEAALERLIAGTRVNA